MEKRWQYRFGSSADPVWDPSPSTIFVKNISLFPKMKCMFWSQTYRIRKGNACFDQERIHLSTLIVCFKGCALLAGCSPLKHTQTISPFMLCLRGCALRAGCSPFEHTQTFIENLRMFRRVRAARRLFPFETHRNNYQRSLYASKGARCSPAVPL